MLRIMAREARRKIRLTNTEPEVQCLSRAAVDLLARCDGSRSVEEVVEVFPEDVRADARRAIGAISDAGLLEPVTTGS